MTIPRGPGAHRGAPAFQVYADNELADTLHLSLEELGAYWRLKLYAWRQGQIPAEPAARARIIGQPLEAATALWTAIASCFVAAAGGAFIHPALEEQRQSQAAFTQNQSTKGIKGARARWAGRMPQPSDQYGRGHSRADGTGIHDQIAGAMAGAMPDVSPDDGSSLFTLHEECVGTDHQHTTRAHDRKMPRPSRGDATGFAEFWPRYPRRVARVAAEAEYARIAPDAALQAKILAGLDRWLASATWQEIIRADPEQRKIPHARTWLHRRSWEDEIVAATGPVETTQRPVVTDDLRALLERAGVSRHDQYTWFSTGMITRDDHARTLRMIITDHDARAFVIKHFNDQLITAAQASNGFTLIISDGLVTA